LLAVNLFTELALVPVDVLDHPSRHLLHWFQSAGKVDASIVLNVVVVSVALKVVETGCFAVSSGAVLLLGKLSAILLCVIRHMMQICPVGLFEYVAFFAIRIDNEAWLVVCRNH